MIRSIIGFSVRYRGLILLLTAVIVLTGWFAFQNLPIDAVPDITNIGVQINTPVEGLVPEEIERNITYPIEAAMGGVADVTQVRSITRIGISQVTVSFKDNVELYRARQLVAERLQTVLRVLPQGMNPTLGPVSTGLGEIFLYSVDTAQPATGQDRVKQLMELRAVQQWYIRPRLLTVDGVAEVNVIGGYEKQCQIQPKPELMAKFGIHFDDIAVALEKTNRNVGGAYVQQTAEQFLVQAVGMLKSTEEIRSVPVKLLENLKTITIGDIAEVELGTDLRTGAATLGGKEAVIGTVLMRKGENSRTVSQRVARRLEEIKKDLPRGIKVETLYDRSGLVNATLGTVKDNLLLGAMLVVVVLLCLLGNLRAAMITALAIPSSLLITFLAMRFFKISGNLMSLGALDFGVIIDSTVIVLDNSVRFIQAQSKKLQRTLNNKEIQEAVFEATVQMRTAAGFGELVIVAVFLPIFALTGVERKMFVPMASTFMIAIVAALILSFTSAPALAGLFLSGKASEREPFLMQLLQSIYEPVLHGSLKIKWPMLGIGLAAIVAGIYLYSRLGGEFLPRLDEGSLMLEIARPVSTSLDESIAMQKIMDGILQEFPEVSRVFSLIGTAEIATDPVGVNQADVEVMLKERKSWPVVDGKRRSKAELVQAITRRLQSELPGNKFFILQPIEMRFNELLEGVRARVSIKVFGRDLDTLNNVASQIVRLVRKVPGAGEVEMESRGKTPILRVYPRQKVLKDLGISNEKVLETIGTAIGGRHVGFVYEGVRRFPIVIRLGEKDRSRLDSIRNLPVGILPNTTVPLEKLADLKFEESPASIATEQSARRVAVLINPRGRDTESFVREAQKSIEAQVKLPPEYYLEWGGNFQNLLEAKKRLGFLAPLALLIVTLMIYFAFGNFLQTLLVITCVPLALVGGVLGLIFNGLPFSISAGVGFIALSGIAVLNGVVLMNFYNQLQAQGLGGKDLIVQGAMIRLRPILMTALVEIFGFFPMMLSQGMGAEVQRPLAAVVIGGVVSSTFLTLLVLPSLCLVFQHRLFPKNTDI